MSQKVPLIKSQSPAQPRRSRRGQSSHAALVDAAEKMIVDHGLSRVSVAQIARAADQRSRAASRYYFKSLEALVMAVLERRGPHIRSRRAAMLAELDLSGRGHDIRAIVEAVVLPVTSLLGDSGAHFRCVVQLNTSFAGDRSQWTHPVDLDHLEQWKARLFGAMGELPAKLKSMRIEFALETCMVSLANFEAALETDPTFDTAFASRALIDAVTAILTGPTGAAAPPA